MVYWIAVKNGKGTLLCSKGAKVVADCTGMDLSILTGFIASQDGQVTIVGSKSEVRDAVYILRNMLQDVSLTLGL